MEEEKFGSMEEEIAEIVQRYEEMRKKEATYFFDVSEFETIIDYYLDLNDVSYAFDAAEAASRQHPGSVSLRLRKAKVLIDKGRALEALKSVRMLESIEPGNYEVYIIKGAALGMLGDITGTRKNFDYALSLDPDDEVNILMSLTSILHNLNHYDLLIPYLKRLVEIEPFVFTHLYDMAFAYEKLHEYERSIEFYNKFLDDDPYSDSAWYNLGILYNKLGKYERSLACYDFALAVNPDNFFALFNKGNILSNTGRFEEALNAYLEYLELEDESSEAMTYAAECYDKLGDKSSARKLYREAIEYDPDFAEPWFGLGMVEMSQSKDGESLHHFHKATELDPDNPEYWYYLGKAYYRMGSVKSAVRSFIEALKLDPFYDIVWADIGHLVISHGAFNHVNLMLERALKTVGDVHGLRYVLAASYLHKGELKNCYDQLVIVSSSVDDEFDTFADLFPEDLLDSKLKSLVNNNLIN